MRQCVFSATLDVVGEEGWCKVGLALCFGGDLGALPGGERIYDSCPIRTI